MIENKTEASRNLEKALQALEQAKQRAAKDKEQKYDKEHKDSLSKYPELKDRMQSLLQNGEKITPKQWKTEIQSLQSEYDSIVSAKSRLRLPQS